jgi:putative PIN family toxin of toxin-antitoxin system
MRVVLDTNVWLSAVFWQGEASQIVELAENKNFKFGVVITKDILLEIKDIILREAKFQKFLENRMENIKNILATILDLAVLVEPARKVSVVEADPTDNKILEAAIAGKADYIISYDAHLTDLKKFENIKILTPSQFIRMFSRFPWKDITF